MLSKRVNGILAEYSRINKKSSILVNNIFEFSPIKNSYGNIERNYLFTPIKYAQYNNVKMLQYLHNFSPLYKEEIGKKYNLVNI